MILASGGAARPADTGDGRTTEWKSQVLRTYQRRTLAADARIASCYLAGTNTRHVPVLIVPSNTPEKRSQ